MIIIKASLTVALPGRVMVSQSLVSLKKTKRTVKGKNNKTYVATLSEEDPEYTNAENVSINVKGKRETVYYRTRKFIPAYQVLNINEEAYSSFISTITPTGVLFSVWKKMSEKERLLWHFINIAEHLGGTVSEYVIFDD